MAKGLIKDSTLTAIANAIREKTETTATMLPSEMAALIQGITGAKVAYGAQTLAPKQVLSSVTITHDLGAIPNIIYVCHVSTDQSIINMMLSLILWPDGTGWVCIGNNARQSQKFEINSETISKYITALTETGMTLKAPQTHISFRSGYYWLAGVV